MFLSKGNTIETVSAGVRTFRNVLSSYISKRFTGRITYRYPAEGIFISIEMVEGTITACRGVALGNLYEGVSCCEVAVNYLDSVEGSIEVVEIKADAIINDTLVFPSSKIEGETALHKQLAAPLKLVEEKQTKQIEIAQPIPIKRTTVSSECIDPLQLYSILKTSQLVFQTNNSLQHIDIEKMVNELKNRNPVHIYISSTVDGQTLRILIDIANRIEYYQLETEGDNICGEEAYRQYIQKKLLNTKIWLQ
ncbi:MAG: hypothetical protein QXU96_00035 [Ignisphaera sp.]